MLFLVEEVDLHPPAPSPAAAGAAGAAVKPNTKKLGTVKSRLARAHLALEGVLSKTLDAFDYPVDSNSRAGQHSQSMYQVMTSFPGLKVVIPSNAYDAKGLLISAIRDNDCVVFVEDKFLYETSCEVPDEAYTIPFGEANFYREGSDVTIVAIQQMNFKAEKAAETLAAEGIDVEIINGLSDGDELVVEGQMLLTDNTKLNVITD